MAGTPAEEPQEADWQLLRQRLSEMGATQEEIQEADSTATLGPLALELALRGSDVVTFEDAARAAGLELEEAARLWRALGFPDPLEFPPRITVRQITTLRVMAGTRALLGDQAAAGLAPVIGDSMARLAEAIVDSFRINVEMPRRHSGEPYLQVVEDYSRTAVAVIPPLIDAIGDLLVGHILSVARASWTLDEQRAAVTRDLVIGFADLVGYTRAARALTPAQLADAIGRFEACAREIVGRHGGRVVKLIGDEVMFVVEDPARAAQLALDLIGEVDGDPALPAVRIGLAAGPVVSHHGDYYGEVVNLAARLVKVAEPGSAITTEAVAEHADGESVELPPLKGYDRPVDAWRLSLR
jgi:adenylate cyclase